MVEQHGISRFEQLPEACLSHIISLTSPKDACRSLTLSKIVNSAADSNTVWERFLPVDYRDIISRACNSSMLTFSSERLLYIYLCEASILLDDAKKSFKLTKASGKKCYMLSSRELGIAWGDNSSYWKWTTLPQSRFTEVAKLYAVCWLEIRAKFKVEMLSHDTTYAAYLIFQLTEQANHDFHVPAKSFIRLATNDEDDELRVELSDIDTEGTFIYLWKPIENRPGRRGRWRQLGGENMVDGRYPRKRLDGWMEIELGVPFNSSQENLSSVEILVWETHDLSWKHGLIVEGIELRPVE
ncbi:hypothetical protein LIER_32583 [Lithospermum erythrorhizon]|uniref:F-box domain-containing protein n=1 Tax=Lithospermum erythrorhizon TaxID=34254 RepID=A0AAV3RXC7_LITER